MSRTEEDQSGSMDDQSKQCRICLDNDQADQLISPCLCTGTFAYVHRECLNHWRSRNVNGRGFEYCDICKFRFVIETVYDDPKMERERLLKYYRYVFRDITLSITLIQLIILTLTFVLRRVDDDASLLQSFPKTINSFLVYYLIIWILLLAVLGFIGSIVYCCSRLNSTPSESSGRSTHHWFTWNSCGSTRSSSNGSGSGKKGNKDGCMAIIVIVILVFAVIGVFVGIIYGIMFVKKISKHHTEKLWLRQEAEKYFVKDFHGRRNELQQSQSN